jgi:P27 family predicted phage terminase small subunit
MKGRKPKPTHLRLIEGVAGHRPLNLDEPQPEGELIDPPDTFSPAQRILWQVTLKNAPEGLLRKLDVAVFASYIVNYAEFLFAAQKIEELGPIVKLDNGQTAHNPYEATRNRANAAMLKAAEQLGFSPASRARVKVTTKPKKRSAFGKLKTFEV